MIVRTRINSTIVTDNIENQGYAVDIRTFDRDGNVVGDNDIEFAGASHLYSAIDATGDYYWHTELFDTGISSKVEFISIALEAHGVSGHVDISHVTTEIAPGRYHQVTDASVTYLNV